MIKKWIHLKKNLIFFINPLASPSAGAPALKYGDVNTVTPSPGEVKGLSYIHGNYIFKTFCENLRKVAHTRPWQWATHGHFHVIFGHD